MIQELNKVAIIHLYLLGLEDDIDNFTLSLNNPSTQSDMLRTEQLQQKIQVYRDAVADAGNGFGAMSMTKAKMEILNMSEEEIRVDLERQRMEKAAAAEMEGTSNIIKKTGLFDRVDSMYGEFGVSPDQAAEGGEAAESGGDMGFGGDLGGGGGFGGGGGMDLGGLETEPLEGGDMGGETAPAEGGGEETEPAPEAPMESFNKKGKLLTEEQHREHLQKRINKHKKTYLKHLMESLDGNKKVEKPVVNKKEYLNEELSKMNNEIDKLIED